MLAGLLARGVVQGSSRQCAAVCVLPDTLNPPPAPLHPPSQALVPERDLRFAIADGGGGKQACTFWHQGRCGKGDACTFAHEGTPAVKLLLPCRFHAQGRCAKGAGCRFSHEPGVVEPCKDLLLYGGCRRQGCSASHDPVPPGLLPSMRAYFLHLDQQAHEQAVNKGGSGNGNGHHAPPGGGQHPRLLQPVGAGAQLV